MTNRFRVLLLLTCVSLCLSAQTDQFVVKFNGDTIRGRLQINPVRDNSKSMYFKHEDGSKENLRPVRISYIYYDEDYQFRSVAFYNQRLFMQIVKEDHRLSLYNYIHKRDNNIATSKVAIKTDGEALEISALTFKKQMKDFLDDCPGLIAKVDSREYRFKDYEQIVGEYNQCDEMLVVSSTASVENNTSASAESTATSGTNQSNTQQPAAVPTTQPEQPGVEPNTTGPTTTTPSQATPSAANGPTASESVAVVAATGSQGSEKPVESASSDLAKTNKLAKIDEFRRYVRGLTDFDQARDLLEWLNEIEFRVIENRSIPNYLWSSLDGMSENHSDLKQKAEELKNELED